MWPIVILIRIFCPRIRKKQPRRSLHRHRRILWRIDFRQIKSPLYLVKNIVDLFTDVSSKTQEFSVYSMQRRFEKVSFAWIFAIEQFQKLEHKLLVDEPFGDRRLKIGRLQKPQEKLVNQLQVWPSSLSS